MLKTIAPFLTLCICLLGQTTPHSITLSWADAINPSTVTYAVYRAEAACPTTSTPVPAGFNAITTSWAPKNLTDVNVPSGPICYALIAHVPNQIDSDPIYWGTVVPAPPVPNPTKTAQPTNFTGILQ